MILASLSAGAPFRIGLRRYRLLSSPSAASAAVRRVLRAEHYCQRMQPYRSGDEVAIRWVATTTVTHLSCWQEVER